MLLFVPACTVVPQNALCRNWGRPASFPQFSHFPPEIRLMIWEFHYREPRDVLIKYQKSPSFSEVLIFQSKTPVPVLFHVCAESRYLGLKMYRRLPALPKAMVGPLGIFADTSSPIHRTWSLVAWVRAVWRSKPCRRTRHREVERAVVPIYYGKSDTVFIMPRRHTDEPSFDNLRALDRTDIADITASRLPGGLYSVLCRVDMTSVIQTLDENPRDNPDIELALNLVLPGVTVLFPLAPYDEYA